MLYGGVGTLLCFAAVFLFARQRVNSYVEKTIIQLSEPLGIKLALQQTALGLSGLRIESGEAFFAKALLLLPFSNTHISPHWSSLIGGKPIVDLQATIAEGAVTAIYNHPGRIEGAITALKLALLPPLAAFGVTDGVSTIKIRNGTIVDRMLRSGDITASIKKLTKPGKTKLPLTLGGFPVSLEIPPLEKGSLDASVSVSQGTVTLEKLESLSSWGTIYCSGELILGPSGQITRTDLKGEIRLTPLAQSVVRPYLPLLGQGALTEESTAFSFSINGSPSRPSWRIQSLD